MEKNNIISFIEINYCLNHPGVPAVAKVFSEEKKTLYLCKRCVKELDNKKIIREKSLTIDLDKCKEFKSKSMTGELKLKATWLNLDGEFRISRLRKVQLKEGLEKNTNLTKKEISVIVKKYEKKLQQDVQEVKEDIETVHCAEFLQARLYGKKGEYTSPHKKEKYIYYLFEDKNYIFTLLESPLFVMDKLFREILYYF
jgi:hypothetical protein